MGVFRQPPQPAQLAGLSAAIFPPIVNSPPLQAMNPQLMVAAWYTTPNPYRPPLVSYTAIFPPVVSNPGIRAIDPQIIATAAYRSLLGYYDVPKFNVPLLYRPDSPPLTPYSQQQNNAVAYTTPNPYRTPPLFPAAVFPPIVDSPPIADYSKQHIAAAYRPPEQPRPLKVWDVDIMVTLSADAPIGLQDPQLLMPAIYRANTGSTQLQIFPSQLFQTVVNNSPPLTGYSPQLATMAAYRSPQYSNAAFSFPSQLFTQSVIINYGRQLLLGVGN